MCVTIRREEWTRNTNKADIRSQEYGNSRSEPGHFGENRVSRIECSVQSPEANPLLVVREGGMCQRK